MNHLALLLGVAAVGFGLSRGLRLPAIPLLMVCGMILPLAGMRAEISELGAVLELGIVVLVFASGIELTPQRFLRHRKAVVWVGLTQFAVIAAAGFGLAWAFGLPGKACFYVACAVSSSSTLVVLRHLRSHQQSFEPFGRLVTGVLLFQDLIMIVVLVVLVRASDGWARVLLGLFQVSALTGLALLCQRWIFPRFLLRRNPDDETLLLVILAVLFAFLGLSFQLELPTLVGGFLAGVAFSAFPLNGIVRGQLNSLTDFFLAIFFTALGAVVVIPTGQYVLQALVLAAMVFLLTPPLVTWVAEACGFGSRPSIASGLLLAQVSEFSLVLALTGMLRGEISSGIFSTMALVAVITMTLTSFLATDAVTRRLLSLHPLWRRLKTEPITAGHILVLGFGAAGMWVVRPLLAEGHRILVVDDDPAVIVGLQKAGIPCLRGDGSDEKVLEKAGARQARLIIASMRRVSEAEKVFHYAEGTPVLARAFEESEADQIRKLGGTPILNSMAAADQFMEWYESRPKG